MDPAPTVLVLFSMSSPLDQVVQSWSICEEFFRYDLRDYLVVSIFPVLLGDVEMSRPVCGLKGERQNGLQNLSVSKYCVVIFKIVKFYVVSWHT
ncbi:hypothetical protein C0J52_28283 [Blattella germanica]|nr:hypothetical protein C0J52_28283 [Blattella germanica]